MKGDEMETTIEEYAPGEVSELVSTRDYCRMRIRDHSKQYHHYGQRTVVEALQIGRYVHEARLDFGLGDETSTSQNSGKPLPSEYRD
jgi:hypothetical protein